jgi:hypothetical protein
MREGKVIYDRSGELKKDAIWRVALEKLWFIADKEKVCYSDVPGRTRARAIKLCTLHPDKHLTTRVYEHIRIVELFGGATVPDFLPIALFADCPVVSRSFAERLVKSKLANVEFKEIVSVDYNRSEAKDPRFVAMQVNGKGGLEHRWKVVGIANSCWHCGKSEIVCSSCGVCNSDCVVCGKRLVSAATRYREGTITRPLDEDPFVIEETDWDRSDFFTVPPNHFVSRRAKIWLESTHTFPLKLEPALLAVKK